MHYTTFQSLSTLNKYVSSTKHVVLIQLLEQSLEPLEIVNIGSLLMWKPFKWLFTIENCKTVHEKLGLILSREEDYVEIHGIIIPILALSSKIINAAPSKDDFPITARMQKWTENPYVLVIKKGMIREDTDKDENDSAADMGDDLAQKMNSRPRLNKHIRFSTTSSSSSADDTKHRGSTPPVGDITEPLI
ncbi:unnamed protein product [Lactuca saligna]|uniref:Uncharacterized protein n=1 Tax=Lactuca saligna TaxID=75948 RepID=A0AA35Z2K5_LACSI|nr:unnamed protein product [Lactuca saligna]